MRKRVFLVALLATGLVSGCNLAPQYVRPEPAAPPLWPAGAAYETAEPSNAAGLPWRSLITHPKLRSVIELALTNNRDLHAAIANVASAKALFRIQKSSESPTVSIDTAATIERGIKSGALDAEDYSANVGVTRFELDLFGRLRSQTRQTFEAYLATESGARATRLSLVAATANAYAALASDRELLEVARATLNNGQRSLDLTQSLRTAGLTSATDVQNAITIVEQAKSEIEAQTTSIAQDRNALELLVGSPVDDAMLPASLAELETTVKNVPAGLSSNVLLQRPDVLEAEHGLKGSYAGIGVARAAFFPIISLTSAAGVASTALRSLFTGGAASWFGSPSVSLPLLGGPNKGNLQFAEAQRDYHVALYEKAVQQAFKEVADGLARRGTILRQRQAQDRLVAAAGNADALSDARYTAGTASFLDALVAQRTLYAAQQSRIAAALTDIGNRIALYQALGADASL